MLRTKLVAFQAVCLLSRMLLSLKGCLSLSLCMWFISVLYCPVNATCSGDGFSESSPKKIESYDAVVAVCSESALKEFRGIGWKENGIQWMGESDEESDIWNVPQLLMSSNGSNRTARFRLVEGEPFCKRSATTQVKLKWNGTSYASMKSVHFYGNGYFRNDTNIYPPDEYCIEGLPRSAPPEEMESMEIRLCNPDCGFGKKRPCIKKCCPLDKIMAIGKNKGCVPLPPGSNQFMPLFHEDIYKNATSSPENYCHSNPDSLMPHFIINHPKYFKAKCKSETIIASPTSDMAVSVISNRTGHNYSHSIQLRLRTDGAIIYKTLENKCNTMSMKRETFCIDGFRGALSFEEDDSQVPFKNTEDEYILFQCPEDDSKLDPYLSFTFGVLLVTTSIFPLITSIVYIMLWKKQNVHGWTIAATSASLFFMYIFQGTAHLLAITLKEDALNTFGCRMIGILLHFFMMSAFTWCSVMTFDLFITFRSVVPMNQRLQGVSRYIKYSIFGWGLPTVMVVISILIDFVITTSDDCSFHEVPGYGQTNCWIVESSLGEYLYYPAGFLLCVNIGLFTATCVKLCMYGKGSAVRARKNNDAFGECFSRFSKLFCVMGISWIFEILSWYVDGLGLVWYWNILDLFNILRAVAIFAIYVCKKDVIRQLEDSYPFIKQALRPFEHLFARKCSEQYGHSAAEVTVLSTGPGGNSPGTAKVIRTEGGSRLSQQNGNRRSQGSCASCDV